MKQVSFFKCIAVSLLFACQNPDTRQEALKPAVAFNEAAETEAIMKVIDNETKSFFDGNYESWASNWSHEPYAMQGWNLEDGTSDVAIGWEKINAQGKGWIEDVNKSGKVVHHPVYKREQPVVKFFNDKTAFLVWKQYNSDKDKKFYQVSKEARIMEKGEDGWKIVQVSAFWGAEPKIPFDSLQLK